MKTLMLHQNPHIIDHNDDPYTVDEEDDELMTLSMLQEYFQDDKMELLPTMVAPEEDLVSSIFIFLTILIK